jgi:bifunctional enzyme Fae/Hps
VILNPKKAYLQVALNSTLDDAYNIIQHLPVNDRVIIEVGTPLIKRYGEEAIRKINYWCSLRSEGFTGLNTSQNASVTSVFSAMVELSKNSNFPINTAGNIRPYIVADLKTMDRGETEVEIAHRGGASAAIALGLAPIETLNTFILSCKNNSMDSMVDMMNVDFPLSILQQLKTPPDVVILHRGVDEETFNKEKQIPLHEIRRIKSRFNIMISIAGGDTIREVQRSIFNDADIVVIWKSVFQSNQETATLVKQFLSEIQ